MICNTQIVTIIIDCISMHCSINMQDSKQLHPYKWNNLAYLVYDVNCFDNEKCDIKLKLYQYYDKIENVNTLRNHLMGNPLSPTQKLNIFKMLYLMYITYVSYFTRNLLKLHALNQYHYQNNLMRSYSGRGLITKNQELFLIYTR